MTTTLFTNIGELVTNDPRVGTSQLGLVRDAGILFDDRVLWVGASQDAPSADVIVDCAGAAVLPGFVDSHAHLVFAGDRAEEFGARMSGTPYGAGGIRSTVAKTRSASDEELRSNVRRLRVEFIRSGVTHFECKTGYGLSTTDELRSLRIASEFTSDATLLAAHVVPPEFRDAPDKYVTLIIEQILPGARGKARWFDVFCDEGAFTIEQTRRLFDAARLEGFELRLHANQLAHSTAVDLAHEYNCASVDHCTYVTNEQIAKLAASDVVVTLLPGAEFSTRAEYPTARRFIDAGVTVALATDCNPGSSYTTSMSFCIAVAVRDMHFTPSEAVYAATAGGAAALRRTDIGNLSAGSRADLIVLSEPSHLHFAYRPGVDLIDQTWIAGQLAYSRKANA